MLSGLIDRTGWYATFDCEPRTTAIVASRHPRPWIVVVFFGEHL